MPNLDTEVAEWVDTAFSGTTDYEIFQDLYSGNHSVKLTDRLKQFLKLPEHQVNSNFCEPIIDVVVERMKVEGFTSADDDLSKLLDSMWSENEMGLLATQIHETAHIKGDAYVIVGWDADEEMVETTLNEPELIRIKYVSGRGRKAEYAVKRWTDESDSGLAFTTIYYPHEIQRYQRKGESGPWVEFIPDGETAWPAPWVMPGNSNEPLGIPVIGFHNHSQTAGVSELRSVRLHQTALNRTLANSLLLADAMGFPIRWFLNTEPPAGGGAIRIFPGAVLEIQAKDDTAAQVGQFDAASPSGLIELMEHHIGSMAAITRTPRYMFTLKGTTQMPSGEALKTAEAGLVKKVERKQVNYGARWARVMAIGRNVQAAFGVGAPEAVTIRTLWGDPETRNELQHLEALAIKRERLGFSERWIWRELGLSQEEMDLMDTDRIGEEGRDRSAGLEALRNFAGGRLEQVGAPEEGEEV